MARKKKWQKILAQKRLERAASDNNNNNTNNNDNNDTKSKKKKKKNKKEKKRSDSISKSETTPNTVKTRPRSNSTPRTPRPYLKRKVSAFESPDRYYAEDLITKYFVPCAICGVTGHTTELCENEFCDTCVEKGHDKWSCRNEYFSLESCLKCNSLSHLTEQCTLDKESSKKFWKELSSGVDECYFCAEEGHIGQFCEKRLKEEQARRDECTALRHMLEQERARAQGKRRRLNSSSTASTADTRVDDDPDGAEETFIKLTTPVDLARRLGGFTCDICNESFLQTEKEDFRLHRKSCRPQNQFTRRPSFGTPADKKKRKRRLSGAERRELAAKRAANVKPKDKQDENSNDSTKSKNKKNKSKKNQNKKQKTDKKKNKKPKQTNEPVK